MRNLKIGAVILLIVLTIAGLCQLLEGITIIRSTGQAVRILTPDGSFITNATIQPESVMNIHKD
jgi:hypothetical protein